LVHRRKGNSQAGTHDTPYEVTDRGQWPRRPCCNGRVSKSERKSSFSRKVPEAAARDLCVWLRDRLGKTRYSIGRSASTFTTQKDIIHPLIMKLTVLYSIAFILSTPPRDPFQGDHCPVGYTEDMASHCFRSNVQLSPVPKGSNRHLPKLLLAPHSRGDNGGRKAWSR